MSSSSTSPEPTDRARRRGWLVDLLVGGVLGVIVAAVIVFNLLIYLGVEGGYHAGIQGAFDHNTFTGVLVVATLMAGPVLGVSLARRRRASRS
ncbi:MAG TPA: hypothetical protein VI141_02160 [Acidimicrobiia bacterium]